MDFRPRSVSSRLLAGLNSYPVVFLNGPRQAGKSTLARMLAEHQFPATYITFDNATQMAAAAAAPRSFVLERSGNLILDEIQLVPQLFRVLKEAVDEQRFRARGAESPTRFLLTGSADIMVVPELADALVGRMAVQTLYPYSVCEYLGRNPTFLDRLFENRFGSLRIEEFLRVDAALSCATFPTVAGKPQAEQAIWFESYLSTIIQRDIRSIAEIEKLTAIPRLLQVLAGRAGSLLNDASIARDVGLNPVTEKSYRTLLNALFLTFEVPPWFRNIGKRIVKSAKGFVTDTSLLCHLLGQQPGQILERRPDLFGHVLENFVATELRKQLSYGSSARLFHFRTGDNREVDFVIEYPDGRLAAVEVKATDQIRSEDFSGIRFFSQIADAAFTCGVILYRGSDVVPFGDNLWAVPLDALWA